MDGDSKGSKTISRAKGENIIRLLKKEGDMNDYTPKFRHWVKSKGFQLISHSALGLKTIAEVGKLFECVPRSAIDKYVALYLVCHMRKPQTTRGPLKPIVSSGFMTRGQVNP